MSFFRLWIDVSFFCCFFSLPINDYDEVVISSSIQFFFSECVCLCVFILSRVHHISFWYFFLFIRRSDCIFYSFLTIYVLCLYSVAVRVRRVSNIFFLSIHLLVIVALVVIGHFFFFVVFFFVGANERKQQQSKLLVFVCGSCRRYFCYLQSVILNMSNVLCEFGCVRKCESVCTMYIKIGYNKSFFLPGHTKIENMHFRYEFNFVIEHKQFQ